VAQRKARKGINPNSGDTILNYVDIELPLSKKYDGNIGPANN